MYFIFTAFSLFLCTLTSTVHGMDRQIQFLNNDAEEDFVQIDKTDANYNPSEHGEYPILPTIIAKAYPLIVKAAPVVDYASRKISSAMRKANPILYVEDENNPKLYQDFIVMLEKDKASFSYDKQHVAKKCLNRHWYCSQALLEALRKQDLESAERNMAHNKGVLDTDFNNQLISALKKAHQEGDLAPKDKLVELNTLKSWFQSLTDIRLTNHPLESIQQDAFRYTIEYIANTKFSALVQSEKMLEELEQARKFEYGIMDQLVKQAVSLENSKNNGKPDLFDHNNEVASAIVAAHLKNIPPVFRNVAKWSVAQEKETIKKKLDFTDEAMSLLSIKS